MSQTLLEQAIAEAYASAPADTIVLHSIELNHKSFTQPARVIRWPVTDNNPDIFRCLLEDTAPYDPGKVVEFIGAPFEIMLPTQSTDETGQFSIRIDNIGDRLDGDLEAAALSGGQITAIYREFIKGTEETDGPSSVWEGISIASPRLEGQTIIVDGSILDWMNRSFGYLYTPESYPGLVRGR